MSLLNPPPQMMNAQVYVQEILMDWKLEWIKAVMILIQRYLGLSAVPR